MAILSRQFGYLFIQTPNTASTSTAALLQKSFQGVRFPSRPIVAKDGTHLLRRKHCTVDDLMRHEALTADEIDGLFKFTTVRNPFDVLVSRWNRAGRVIAEAEADPTHWLFFSPRGLESRRQMAGRDFSDWIVYRYRRSASLSMLPLGLDLGVNGKFAKGVDFVMRFENLESDFATAMRRIGIDASMPLPRFNVDRTRGRNYRPYYSAKARRIVEKVLRKELDSLGYEF